MHACSPYYITRLLAIVPEKLSHNVVAYTLSIRFDQTRRDKASWYWWGIFSQRMQPKECHSNTIYNVMFLFTTMLCRAIECNNWMPFHQLQRFHATTPWCVVWPQKLRGKKRQPSKLKSIHVHLVVRFFALPWSNFSQTKYHFVSDETLRLTMASNCL